jgi:hypothetical protein
LSGAEGEKLRDHDKQCQKNSLCTILAISFSAGMCGLLPRTGDFLSNSSRNAVKIIFLSDDLLYIKLLKNSRFWGL